MGFNSLSNVIAGLCSSYFVVEENEWATWCVVNKRWTAMEIDDSRATPRISFTKMPCTWWQATCMWSCFYLGLKTGCFNKSLSTKRQATKSLKSPHHWFDTNQSCPCLCQELCIQQWSNGLS
jgi:hypothetical protein